MITAQSALVSRYLELMDQGSEVDHGAPKA
jgi:hypothetical protein